MIHSLKNTMLVGTFLLLLGAAAPADAARTSKLESTCKQAVQAELEDGKARINRVSIVSSGEDTTFWMTVRHKTPTQAKSTRYRATCTINKAGETVNVELEPGWWQKTGRSAPVAVKF